MTPGLQSERLGYWTNNLKTLITGGENGWKYMRAQRTQFQYTRLLFLQVKSLSEERAGNTPITEVIVLEHILRDNLSEYMTNAGNSKFKCNNRILL